MHWLSISHHRDWLQQEAEKLLAFGVGSPQQGLGAAWLDGSGHPDLTQAPQTWITSRMVHVYGLGHLMGIPGCRAIAARAMSGLTGRLRDETYRGWFHTADREGDKVGYDHAFVVLAGSTASIAGIEGGQALLEEALDIFETRFWDEDAGLIVDAVSPDFAVVDEYRGLNANMHGVEALLAAFDATGDRIWLDRAERIARFAVAQAANNQWRLPEHYDSAWRPQLELNADRKDDQFRPYGATPGHGMEWARLLLHLEATLASEDPMWLESARALYHRAVADGWDGAGFVYTTGWDGVPVTPDRFHWVAAEAIGAAATLAIRTGEDGYADDYARWWDNVAEHFIDTERGSWHHQLDPANRPSDTVWPGKPDLYHAFQATLIPRLPLAPSMAKAVAEGRLT